MVYLLLDSSGFGGIESHVQQLALLIRQQAIDVEVVFIRRYCGHPQYALLQQHQIPFRFLSDTSSWAFFRQLSRQDVIHAHGYKAAVMARLFRVVAGYRLVTSFHAGEALNGRLACYEWANRYTSFLSSNLAVSEKILKTLPFNCQLLRNFVFTDPEPLVRQRHAVLQVGFVGRLSHEKGIDRFVELSRCCSGSDFHVFGDGELSGVVEEAAELHWHGAVDSMAQHWQQLDLLVISSRAEGLPMAALEAMANGVPVIATNVGDMAALLPQACLVEEHRWQLLSRLIEQLAKADGEVWNHLSREARKRIDSRFSALSRWPQLASVYQLPPVSG